MELLIGVVVQYTHKDDKTFFGASKKERPIHACSTAKQSRKLNGLGESSLF